MNHPERFNEDGSNRMIRVRDGQTIRGTFPTDQPQKCSDVTNEFDRDCPCGGQKGKPSCAFPTDSRQVRRFKVRTAAFNELSRYNLPRTVRRAAAINARLEAK